MQSLHRLYTPALRWALGHKAITLLTAAVLFGGAILLSTQIGSEFMPQLDEGDLMYMPVTDPGISIGEALSVMQRQDRILHSFPEVEWVVGKAGRAETSTDPAPVNMNETIVHLKPREQWRPGLTRERLVAEMDERLVMPGVTNIWTQPIINRIEMLSTGIRTQVGVKIFGSDLNELERRSREVAAALRTIPGAVDVYAEQITGAPYLDIKIDRTAAARYGIEVDAIQQVIETGIGETNLTVTIEGRKRFPVRVRYGNEYRATPDDLGKLLVPAPNGLQIPLSQVATIRSAQGPAMVSSENGLEPSP
jgi:Cu(I)/Ag(I) efflux system membrane protein CusA/SilA